MKMDETQFSEQLRKLQEPSGPSRMWESPVFAMQDYESMTDSQLSKVVLEMLKFTGPGSYWLRQDLFEPKMFGNPDFLIQPNIIVFCDSSFWHGRDWSSLRKRLPQGYWREHIERNRKRDRLVNAHLKKRNYATC
jgi:DNA mismatch endonuclease (patch repair protein)